MLHLLGLGVWIGVVGAEFAIEAVGAKDDDAYIEAAKLHYTTDIWVEIPAFSVVLFTGLAMLAEHHLTGLLLWKVIFGSLAIVFNIVCVYAVFKRRNYALSRDLTGMKSTDTVMKIGGGIIPTFLIAFGLGIYIALT